MLELGSISLTVFSYVTEENNRVVKALYNCLPSKYHNEKLVKIASNSQFGDPLIIYSYETDNAQIVKDTISHLSKKLSEESKQYLTDELINKTDFESRTIYIRLDKYKAFEEDIVITEGSDIIKLEISYNAYTKAANSQDTLIDLLRESNLIG